MHFYFLIKSILVILSLHIILEKIFKKSILLNKKIPFCSPRRDLFESVFISQIRRAVDQIQQ